MLWQLPMGTGTYAKPDKSSTPSSSSEKHDFSGKKDEL
jgi:hypothetical protein